MIFIGFRVCLGWLNGQSFPDVYSLLIGYSKIFRGKIGYSEEKSKTFEFYKSIGLPVPNANCCLKVVANLFLAI